MATPAGLAPARSESKSDALLLSYRAKYWFPWPGLHRHCGSHKAECYCYNTKGMKEMADWQMPDIRSEFQAKQDLVSVAKWSLRVDLHHEPHGL